MEHEPFLQHDDQHSLVPGSHQDVSPKQSHLHLPSFFFCIFSLKFCNQFSVSILGLPMLRLVESTICRSYVNGQTEEDCKIPLVQDKTAIVIGYQSTFDALPCLLTALFYGSISNSRGRRYTMFLSNLGQTVALLWVIFIGFLVGDGPVELFWVSSIFLLIGGGIRSESAMQYTSLCDVVLEKDRTWLLSFFHAAAGIAGLIGYPTSYFLLKNHLWTPFVIALTNLLLKYIILYYTPETSPYLTGHTSDGHTLPLESSHDTISETDEDSQLAGSTSDVSLTVRHWSFFEIVKAQIRALNLKRLFKYKGLKLIFAYYIAKRVGFASLPFAPQFASEVLHTNIHATFWLGTFHEVGALIVLTLLIPLLIRTLKTPVKDIFLIRGSVFVLMIGFFILWRSRSMVAFCLGLLVCGLGEGLETGLQALGAYVVGHTNHSTFFSLASIFGLLGELLGGPLMSMAYAGRGQAGEPLGYCFLASLIIFGSLLVGSYFIKVRS